MTAAAVATLAPAAILLREALLLAFGSGAADPADLVRKLATPVAYTPVGAALWIWHWRFLQREAAEYGESEEGTVVRRLYYYVVAAVLALPGSGAVISSAHCWMRCRAASAELAAAKPARRRCAGVGVTGALAQVLRRHNDGGTGFAGAAPLRRGLVGALDPLTWRALAFCSLFWRPAGGRVVWQTID